MEMNEERKYIPDQKERTLPGVHNDLVKSIVQMCPLSGWQSILDVGAGEGALSARLKSEGYQIEALEIVEGRFTIPEVKCYKVDLNSRFADKIDKKFDILVAVEVKATSIILAVDNAVCWSVLALDGDGLAVEVQVLVPVAYIYTVSHQENISVRRGIDGLLNRTKL